MPHYPRGDTLHAVRPIRPRADLTGQVFDHLTVLERIGDHVTPSGGQHARYRCMCDCGTETLVLGHNLTGYRTTSCGHTRGRAERAFSISDVALPTPTEVAEARVLAALRDRRRNGL